MAFVVGLSANREIIAAETAETYPRREAGPHYSNNVSQDRGGER
jgi:hypothetical protein